MTSWSILQWTGGLGVARMIETECLNPLEGTGGILAQSFSRTHTYVRRVSHGAMEWLLKSANKAVWRKMSLKTRWHQSVHCGEG